MFIIRGRGYGGLDNYEYLSEVYLRYLILQTTAAFAIWNLLMTSDLRCPKKGDVD